MWKEVEYMKFDSRSLIQQLLNPIYYMWQSSNGYKLFKLESRLHDEDGNVFYNGCLITVKRNGFRYYYHSYDENIFNELDKKVIKESDFKRIMSNLDDSIVKVWQHIESIES